MLLWHALDVLAGLAIGLSWLVVMSLPWALSIEETSRAGKIVAVVSWFVIVLGPALVVPIWFIATAW